MSKIDPSEYDLDDKEAEKVLKRRQKRNQKQSGKSKSKSGKSDGGSDDEILLILLLVITILFLSFILGVPASEVWDVITGMGAVGGVTLLGIHQ